MACVLKRNSVCRKMYKDPLSVKSMCLSLQDKDFGKTPLHRAHINPAAEVSTTLKIYQRFSLDRAYLGDTHFWAFIPHAGDVVLFKFTPPIKLERCELSLKIKSGSGHVPQPPNLSRARTPLKTARLV